MGKLIKMDVLIVGMRGLGVEVAKNLILAGPKSVTIYDPTNVSIADMGANFYICEADVGNKTRAEACVSQLKGLNPHVNVRVINEFNNDMVSQFSVVCITENLWNSDRLEEIN